MTMTWETNTEYWTEPAPGEHNGWEVRTLVNGQAKTVSLWATDERAIDERDRLNSTSN